MRSRRSLWRRVGTRLSVERHLWNWRRLLAPLRATAAPSAERAVLFCDLMAMLATAKVEALMAGLLRLKGYRTIVLLEKPERAIEQIFRAAAADAEFIYLSSAIGAEETAATERDAAAILARADSLQGVVEFEIDGFRIGRNVQSMVLRHFRVGRLDDDNPQHREATQRTLARSLAVKAFVTRMLTERSIDVAVFNERGYTPAGEVFDGCITAGIDVMQWCGAPQADCLIFRRYDRETRSEHPLTLSDDMWRRLLGIPWTVESERAVIERIAANYGSGAWYNRQQLQDGKVVLSPDGVRQSLGLDPSKKTAVIFTHILYDATFFYGESLFEDYEQWLVETVRAAIANPRLNWVVKVHPVNVWRSRMDGAELVQLEAEALHRAFGELPKHVTLMAADTPVNTFSLFEVADYGLTVRGTIGMELPCFGIPVVTAGTGRYSGRGFTLEPGNREEYAALLATLHDVPRLDNEAIRHARLHYHGALNLRPVPIRSFIFDYHAGKKQGAVQAYDVVLTRKADKKLLDTNDLGRLIKWLTESKAPELLARDI